MTTRRLAHHCTLLVAAAAVVAACQLTVAEVFKDPPPGSYTTATRQLTVGNQAAPIQTAAVSLDFFRGVGAPPLMGRFFTEADQSSSSPRVVVLSHDLWEHHFASKTDVGQPIDLDGQQLVVIGIARPGFRAPDGASLWTLRETR